MGSCCLEGSFSPPLFSVPMGFQLKLGCWIGCLRGDDENDVGLKRLEETRVLRIYKRGSLGATFLPSQPLRDP